MPQTLTGLGRRYSFDPRDRQHLLPPKSRAGMTFRNWTTPKAYDQGATSQCVAYSGVRFLTSAPIVNKPIDFAELYNACKEVDEWAGTDYDGTSVRALMKVLKARDKIESYKWAFDCETVISHVLTTGPVVMGTVWTDDMAMPDREGFIEVGKLGPEDDEGHAWTIVGANVEKEHKRTKKKGAARLMNSWGDKWGEKGRAWITFDDLDRLIQAQGEGAVAIEKRAA